MALIDKDKVVAEINKLQKKARDLYGCSQFDTAYDNVLEAIDTLEEADVDIEKKAEEDWNTIFPLGYGDTTFLTLNHKEFMAFVKHYYELGLKVKKGE